MSIQKSALSVNVEFLAGTDIDHAIIEAKHKARLWDVAYVCFDFNGTKFSIGQEADVKEAQNEYQRSRPKSIIFA